jgi:RimJ/RimL family protein N-acetyltransferase
MKLEPVTLTGKVVSLEPLELRHAADLFALAQDPVLWTYMPSDPSGSLEDMEHWISKALKGLKAGTALAFVIVDLATQRIVGSTRYFDFSQRNRGVEIGSTWLSPSVWRTGVNTECKYLLLRHAFETLEMIRVQLKTHHLNVRSQNAIERIGATREGVLRNHVIMPDGSYRHSVYFSIIESEWPQVKANLEAKMLHSQ